MHTRRSKLVLLGFAVALVMLACAPSSSSPLRLITSDVPQLSGMEALHRGTLRADENGCVHSKTTEDSVALVWPQGYTVKGDSKSFEVLNGSKKVVARSGSPFTMGGGYVDSFQDTWTEPDCAKGKLWMVGRVEEAL